MEDVAIMLGLGTAFVGIMLVGACAVTYALDWVLGRFK